MNLWQSVSEMVVLWEPLSKRIALTILHFVWQGALASIVLGLVLRLIRPNSARMRYAAACCALACLPITAVMTFVSLELNDSQPASLQANSPTLASDSGGSLSPAPGPIEFESTVEADESEVIGMVVSTSEAEATSGDTPRAVNDMELIQDPAANWLRAGAWLISILYAAGLALMLMRTLVALYRGRRLRLAARPCQDTITLQLVAKLTARLGLKTAPQVLLCQRVLSPAVSGVLRPAILLPASLATTLTTAELSAVLAHELAHIRRYDLWTNMLQRVVETLLFFHPATWWISKMVSDERENCCDDLAVAEGISRLEYVAALLRVAELCRPMMHSQWREEVVALSADGGDASQFARRVERLLGASAPPPISASRGLSMLILAGILSAGLWAVAAPPQAPEPPGDAAESRADHGQHVETDEESDGEDEAEQPKEMAEPRGVRWGEAVDGLRLGIRPKLTTKPNQQLRIGNELSYEVWIRNETSEPIHIPRNPLQQQALVVEGHEINLLGPGVLASYAIDPKEFERATLTVPANASRNLILHKSVGAVIRTPDSVRALGFDPLRIEPGKYQVVAKGSVHYHTGDRLKPERLASKSAYLKSLTSEIQVSPAPRLQLRQVSELSPPLDRESAVADRRYRLVRWTPHQGDARDMVVHENLPLMLDEDDLRAFHGFGRSNLGKSYLRVSLSAAATERLAKTTEWMSRPRTPNTSLGVFLDGELISVRSLTKPIEGQFPVIPLSFSESGAKRFESFLNEAMFRCPCQTAWSNAVAGLKLGARLMPTGQGGGVDVELTIRNVTQDAIQLRFPGATEATTLAKNAGTSLEPVRVSWRDSLAGDFRVTPRLIFKGDGILQPTAEITQRRGDVMVLETELSQLASFKVLGDVGSADDQAPINPGESEGNAKVDNIDAADEKIPTEPTRTFDEHLNVRDIAINRRGDKIVSVATESGVTIRTWDVATGFLAREVKLDTELHGNRFLTSRMKLTQDGKRLFTIVMGELRIWDAVTGKQLAVLSAPEEQGRVLGGRVLATVMNGSVVAAAEQLPLSGFSSKYDCDVLVWETTGNKLLGRLTHPDAVQITALAISADGRWLASGSQNGSTCIFDLEQGTLVHEIKNENRGVKHPDPKVVGESADQVVCLEFSPDETTLAIGDMLGVKLMRVEDGKVTRKFGKPFRFGFSGLTFSPDGRYLARVATDKVAPIWSLESGQLVAELPTECHSGKFSRDGRMFATGFSDRKQALTLWRLPKSFAAQPKRETPPKGLGFLTPYPELYGLSLDMTKEDFRQLAKRNEFKFREADDKKSFWIPMKDGHVIVVMFGGERSRCSGIQRLRGQ